MYVYYTADLDLYYDLHTSICNNVHMCNTSALGHGELSYFHCPKMNLYDSATCMLLLPVSNYS